MLLFFTFTTVFCLTKFHNQQYQYVHRLIVSYETDYGQVILLRLVAMARNDRSIYRLCYKC